MAKAEVLGLALRAKGCTVATAESCTGGWVAKVLTDVAGSSAWFEAGIVAYSYKTKQALLGVQAQTLVQTGAVSRETALEMVAGAQLRADTHLAVAVTGIAGPGGGTPDKPVGSVWIAWKRDKDEAHAQLFHFEGGREAVRCQTVAAALDGLMALLD